MHQHALTPKEKEALQKIRSFAASSGRTPSIRELAEELGYDSPRYALTLRDRLINKGWLARQSDGKTVLLSGANWKLGRAETIHVPLVGTVAAGSPILAEQNIEATVPVSTKLARPGGKYFLLRVAGTSMNAAGISDGDLVLVRQQPSAENGQKVVALIDDSATVKEYQASGDVVLLKPRSHDPEHQQPIVMDNDFQIQGVVVATLPSLVEDRASRKSTR